MIKKLGLSDDNIVAIYGKKGTDDSSITSIWIQVKEVVKDSSTSYRKALAPEYKKLANLSVDTKAPKDTAFFKLYG